MTHTHAATRAPPPVRAPASTARLEGLLTAAVGVIVQPLYAPRVQTMEMQS
jgi:hypothetical protein